MAELNPYAPPAADDRGRASPDAADAPGVFRDGNHVVVARKDARLPDRCVVCNAPAVGDRIHHQFTWHPSWVYLTFLIGMVVYWIAAGATRRLATVDFSLCAEHHKRRGNGLLLGWIGGVGAFVLFVVGLTGDLPVLTLLAVLLAIVVPGAGWLIARTASAAKIDERHVWLRVGAPFLASIRERAA
jgi:hypothetical protein